MKQTETEAETETDHKMPFIARKECGALDGVYIRIELDMTHVADELHDYCDFENKNIKYDEGGLFWEYVEELETNYTVYINSHFDPQDALTFYDWFKSMWSETDNIDDMLEEYSISPKRENEDEEDEEDWDDEEDEEDEKKEEE